MLSRDALGSVISHLCGRCVVDVRKHTNHATMLGLLASAAVAHVPTYDSGSQQCLTPPRTHTTSQVLYVLAEPGTTSGLEV